MVNLGYAAFFEAGTKKIMLHTHVWQKKVAKFYQFSQVFRQSWSTYKPRSPESNSRFTSRISCALIYLQVVSRCRHPQQSRALNLEMNQFCFVFSLPARDFPKLMRSCQKIPARTRSPCRLDPGFAEQQVCWRRKQLVSAPKNCQSSVPWFGKAGAPNKTKQTHVDVHQPHHSESQTSSWQSIWKFADCFLKFFGANHEPTYGIAKNYVPGWWFQPLWKILISQLGWLFPKYGKIKNVPNHQPVVFVLNKHHETLNFLSRHSFQNNS